MAQTGYTPILIYSTTTAAASPAAANLTNSTLGSELAINITDGKLFYKDNSNVIQVIGWKTTPTSAGGTGLTSYTAGDTLYYASGTALSKLAIGSSGNYMSSSGTAPQWSAPAALTKTDDTNVTLTLGGSASTALLNAASLTLGWTGQLAASRGGTGTGTYAVGDILYASGTTALSKLAIGTAYYMLGVNAGATAPSWQPSSTSTLTTQGDLLYASAANTLARLAKNTTASRYLSNGGTNNNPSWAQIDLSNGVTGTLPIANGGTNATATPTNGGVAYGTGTAYAFTAAGTSNYLLQSAGAAAPTWSNALSVSTLATSSTITPTGRTATYFDAAYKNAGTTMTWAYTIPNTSVHLVTIYQQNDTNVGFAPGMYLVMRQGTQTNIVTIAAAGQVASVAIDGSYQFTATLSVSYNNIIYGSILRLI